MALDLLTDLMATVEGRVDYAEARDVVDLLRAGGFRVTGVTPA